MKRGSIRRLCRLDTMIRLGQLCSADDAAREFEISRRTIERDLEMLRYELNAEVRYNREKGRYEYIGNPLPLPGQWLNEKEIAIMLIAERSLRIHTSASFSDQVHPVFNKLLQPIRDDKKAMSYIRELCASVYFHRPFEPLRDLRNEFSAIFDAIVKRKRVSMRYQTAARSGNMEEKREVDPYALVNSGGDWYILGFCRISREIRTFSLSRVYEPELVDRYFEIPESFKVEEHLAGGFGRMRGGEARDIRLHITPPAAAWIGSSKWHSTQKLKNLENGAIQLSLRCPVTDSLVRWVLQMGGSVKVEAPEELRALVVKNARELMAANGE